MKKEFGVDKEVFLCPHCGIPTQHILNVKHEYKVSESKLIGNEEYVGNGMYIHFIYRCSQCNKDTYFLKKENSTFEELKEGMKNSNHTYREISKILHQYPVHTPIIHSAVPEEVKNAAIEATNCLSVGAYNACGVMLRRAIHCICSEKSAPGNNLYEKLEWLKNNNIIYGKSL